jgi:CHAD domain-containing protein
MPVSAHRSELLKSRVVRFTRVLQGIEQGDVRALHRARVGSRRLRELLPVLQLDADTTKKLVRRLRKITTRLGAVRELDVLLLLTAELQDTLQGLSSSLRYVGAGIAKDRDAARKHLSGHLPVNGMRRIAAKLNRVVRELSAMEGAAAPAAPGAARAWRWAIDARIAQRADRLARAIRAAGAMYVPERLHEARIALKKLRYALELSAEASGGRTSPTLRRLKRAQDSLGRMHDLQVLIDRVREAQASLAMPNLTTVHDLDALVVALENECRRLHARYVHERDALTTIAERHRGRAVERTTAWRVEPRAARAQQRGTRRGRRAG